MTLQERISLLERLGKYMMSKEEAWLEAKLKAEHSNNWFITPFIDHAISAIASQYLSPGALSKLVNLYSISGQDRQDKTLGLVMAGNIPLVGFHDFLCVFLSGFKLMIKASAKDEVLIKHLVSKLAAWDARVEARVAFTPMLKGADAYIATGSNNSGRYFDFYFKKYPHIIRRNRTSVAILSGGESAEDLKRIADDVHLYFGMGCRNITKLFVPVNYDFVPLLKAFEKYSYFSDHHKYKNNYDYYLAISLLNNQYYMTNGSILLLENISIFSPISVLNYEYYNQVKNVSAVVSNNKDIQCVSGKGYQPFGVAQSPDITDFADGVDTMHFLTTGV